MLVLVALVITLDYQIVFLFIIIFLLFLLILLLLNCLDKGDSLNFKLLGILYRYKVLLGILLAS